MNTYKNISLMLYRLEFNRDQFAYDKWKSVAIGYLCEKNQEKLLARDIRLHAIERIESVNSPGVRDLLYNVLFDIDYIQLAQFIINRMQSECFQCVV